MEKKTKDSTEKIIFYSAAQSPVADCYCYPPLVISRAAVIAGGVGGSGPRGSRRVRKERGKNWIK